MNGSSQNIVYQSEAMLIARKPDSVTFALDGDYDNHPFIQGRVGADNGTRYALVVVEIDDDEQPINQQLRDRFKKTAKRTARTTALDKVRTRAVLQCKDEYFQQFVYKKIQKMDGQTKRDLVETGMPYYTVRATPACLLKGGGYAEDWAKHYIYWRCDIHSRAQLAYSNHKVARDKFQVLMDEFKHWSGV